MTARESESTHYSLEPVGGIGEFLSLEPNFGASSDISVPWSNVGEDWLLVVSEAVSSVDPIEGIERDPNSNCIAELSGWRSALNPGGLYESASDNLVSESAEWELAVHGVLAEPGAGYVDDRTTRCQTIVWLKLGDDWVPVEHELEVRGVVVGALDKAGHLLPVRRAVSVVVSNADVDIFSDKY